MWREIAMKFDRNGPSYRKKNLVIETFFETPTDDKVIFAWFFGYDLLGPHTSSPGIVLFDVFIGDYSPPKNRSITKYRPVVLPEVNDVFFLKTCLVVLQDRGAFSLDVYEGLPQSARSKKTTFLDHLSLHRLGVIMKVNRGPLWLCSYRCRVWPRPSS